MVMSKCCARICNDFDFGVLDPTFKEFLIILLLKPLLKKGETIYKKLRILGNTLFEGVCIRLS